VKAKVLAVFTLVVFIQSLSFDPRPVGAVEPRGLRLRCGGVSPGYTLFAPLSSQTTYLIDLDGQVVQTWKSDLLPSAWVYLLDNGHVLRGGSDPGFSGFAGGGQGGRFQEFDFDGNLVWDFKYNPQGRLPHHDVAVLPNGNILAIVWEIRSAEEARNSGRKPAFTAKNGIWPDMLIEFEPQKPNGGRIVWEWHIWDHLVQDIDPALNNFGDLAQHPELINVNGDTIGNVATPNPPRDVFHTNSVNYNADLDEILLSEPNFNEVWVIDHSTTTQEAASHSGGRSGKGGDLLYRWGNPQTYGRGVEADRLLGFQHDAHWIPQGLPGAGNMMVFSTQTPGPNGDYTKVYEFVPPVDANGRYPIPVDGPFEPAAPVWTYSKPDTFQASLLSGAERMANGNTMISSGPQGRLFEVTPAGDIVWEYWSPYGGNNAAGFTLFRALKVPPDHPGLKDRNLIPLVPQPPISPAAVINAGTSGACPVPPSVNAPAPPAPTLTGIHPTTGKVGTSVSVTLTGTNMLSSVISVSGGGVAVGSLQAVTPESITSVFTIAPDAVLGKRDVTVTTSGGTSSSVSFTLTPPQPTLSSITPAVGARATGESPVHVSLTGTNFATGMTLDAGPGIAVSDITVMDSTKATANFGITTTATLGLRQVSIATSGGTSEPVAFTVADPFPDLSIASSHVGDFAEGFDETYTVTVTNEGMAPTKGMVVVSETLPAGLTFVSGEGPGWSCSASGQAVLCTNASVLATNASTGYTLTVAVNGDAAHSLAHAVSVAADGDLNAANNSATDLTTVVTPSPLWVITPSSPIAGQEATVAATMDTPFPHDISGSLTLTFSSSAAIPADDPAIQFAAGGRTVTFTIPANSKEARFGGAPSSGPLAFQTGTVAGTLEFTGTAKSGTVETSFEKVVTLPPQAPAIQRIQTIQQNGFAAVITLMSPMREVSDLILEFHTNSPVRLSCGTTNGCSASESSLTFDVREMFNSWFAEDSTFGSLSMMRIPLSIPASVHGSVVITLRNSRGPSNSMSFALP
jgi:hypothetical protein